MSRLFKKVFETTQGRHLGYTENQFGERPAFEADISHKIVDDSTVPMQDIYEFAFIFRQRVNCNEAMLSTRKKYFIQTLQHNLYDEMLFLVNEIRDAVEDGDQLLFRKIITKMQDEMIGR